MEEVSLSPSATVAVRIVVSPDGLSGAWHYCSTVPRALRKMESAWTLGTRITNPVPSSARLASPESWNFLSGSGSLRAGVSAASGPAPDLTGLTPGLCRRFVWSHQCPSGSGQPPAAVGYKCRGGGIEAALAPFFLLALLPRSFSSLELFAAPTPFLFRSSGEPQRAVAPTILRRATAASPPIRRHGATRIDGALFSTAISSGEERLFFALRLSWTSSSSSSSMAQPSGSWKGSYMQDDDIARLVRLRRIPAGVITRAPGAEEEPRPEPGERVVFGAHLDRGLGLPASNFFRRFLDHFGLQPHHLPANAMILLSCYVAFMEGYAGLWPDVEFWSRLFYIKAQTTEGRLRTCGAASIYPRTGTSFPRIPTVDSVKNWQMSFFYVRNESPAFDRLNLPEFNPAPPVGRINWGYNPKSSDPDAEVNLLWDFLGQCVTEGRLSAEDLLCTYISRRVIPLQWRVHKIGHMSGLLDPTRTSKLELSKAQVAHRVNNITKANMPDNWDWGLAPYDREQPPELLFTRQGIEDGDLATKVWTPDLVDPADLAGDQAGDDDLPVAQDQGGQGEHNPPPSPEHEQEQEQEQLQAEPAQSGTGAIPAVPLRAAPPTSTATSAPKGRKRAGVGSTAASEARAKKQRRLAPKKVPEKAGAAIKFTQGGGSRQAPPVTSPLQRQRREPTPQPSARARTPPAANVPPAATPPAGASSSAFCGAWRRRPGSVGAPADLRRHVSAPRPVCGAGSRSWQGHAICGSWSWSWWGCAAFDRSRRVRAQRRGAGEFSEGSASSAGCDGSHRADCFDRAASSFGADEEGADREGAGEGGASALKGRRLPGSGEDEGPAGPN
ncbi:hypothetical protein QYE76_068206 [Lolium multiflorum]|uniref:Transposase (putative) gypsy type domain-containing protein n=1 Tax=Lolium multiflorum TaxID=4521 RepID=A0AAD8WBH1_LOLMU|nr:hypothetical protein QYE76_068206 [Lolium multiflorum]